MKSAFALCLLCLLAVPALAAEPGAPVSPTAPVATDFQGMSLEQLKAYYDEGAFTSYRDAMKALIDRGQLEEIHQNLRDRRLNRDHYMSAWAVAWMQPEAFLDDMVALLDDPDPGVRFYAVYYLSGLRKQAYADQVAKRLADPAPEVRRMAASYFGSLKLVAYRAALSKLSADPDPGVRTYAQEALKKLP